MNIALFDNEFLKKLNEQHNHTIYARILSLNFSEEPLEQIEGRVTGGNISIDGDSAIRRSCSLTLTAKDLVLHDYYWSLNTKIKIEIGLQNTINSKYDDIIWFPQGIFLITSFTINSATNNYTISITGKDKMSLLNGEIGGYLGLQTTFDKWDEQITDEDGNITQITSHQELIKRIIKDLVNTYGHEPFSNIIINDLDIYGLRQISFSSWDETIVNKTLDEDNNELLYLLYNETDQVFTMAASTLSEFTQYRVQKSATPLSNTRVWSSLIFKDLSSINDDTTSNATIIEQYQFDEDMTAEEIASAKEKTYTLIKITSGEICGYEAQDLVYDDDLIGNATDTVTSILDKIVKKLGEFEYFYNTNGQFVFQEKNTYVQSPWNNLISTDKEKYVDPNEAYNYLSYSFEGSNLITSFQNNPNINNIKNDYIVWGEKKSSSGGKIPIHAHYAIDKKPVYYRSIPDEDHPNGIEYVSSRALSNLLTTLDNYPKEIPDWAEYYNPANLANDSMTVDGMTKEELAVKYKDICDNWWDLLDWANYYAIITGEHPSSKMYTYQSSYDQLNLEGIFTAGRYHWDQWKIHPCGIFDVYPYYGAVGKYGTLGFTGHNPSYSKKYEDLSLDEWTTGNIGVYCYHDYDYFLSLYNNLIDRNSGRAYFYKPKIPQAIIDSQVQEVDWREILYQMALDYANHKNDDDFLSVLAMQNPDYYPTGVTGYEQYYSDIESYWRTIYDPTKASDATTEYGTYNGWHNDVYENPSSLTFWFDFFNCENNDLERFSVPVIGSRSKVINDNTIKMITHEQVPDIIYLSSEDGTYEDIANKYSLLPGYLYVNDAKIYEHMKVVTSTKGKTAQEMIETLLYTYGQANETITLQAIPIYYLEPNTLIYVHDNNSNINNIYIINKISLSLTYNGMMTINATKMPDTLT